MTVVQGYVDSCIAGGRVLVLLALAGLCAIGAEVAVAATPSGSASPDAGPSGTEPESAAGSQLANKLRLLQQLVHGSPMSRRIEASDDDDAKALLQAAREAAQQAAAESQRGDFEAAERSFTRGLDAVGVASRLVTDSERLGRVARERNAELRGRIASFRDAFGRLVAEKAEAAALLDADKIDMLWRDAELQAEGGDFNTANEHLEKLAGMLERALSRARHSETLVHTLQFASPGEEYTYELDRNRSYEMLLRLLGADKPLSEARRAYVKSMKERNEALRAKAQGLAANGNAQAAISALEEGTLHLEGALRAGGLALP